MMKTRKPKRMKLGSKGRRATAGNVLESDLPGSAARSAGRREVHVGEHRVGQELEAELLILFIGEIKDEEGGCLLLQAPALAVDCPCV